MTLNELRYIVAVARERHFGRAAAACHVSQPTLSVAVKKLEDELGVVLFERGRPEVAATAVGARIVEQAQQVLEAAAGIPAIAESGRDQLRGALRLGAINTVGPYLFPLLIPELHERAPHMPLVIEENLTARLAERLKRGELDAILIALPFEEPGVLTLSLYDEPFVVVLPASHPWRERERIPAADLAGEDLLLLAAGHCFRDQVLQACPGCQRSAGAETGLHQTREGGSLETIRHMVASGIGITVLPCSAVRAERYARHLLAVRRFAPPVPRRRVALAWRASFPRPKAIEALRRAVLASGLTCVEPVA